MASGEQGPHQEGNAHFAKKVDERVDGLVEGVVGMSERPCLFGCKCYGWGHQARKAVARLP